MMKLFTAERSNPESSSDNPIFQRHLFAYEQARPFIKGKVLEVGCGEGYGMMQLATNALAYVAIDKFPLQRTDLPPNVTFHQTEIPPLSLFDENTFDVVVSFQVIEHIKKDGLFVEEIARVLKPDGQLILTTPNRKMSLTRNPWHVREYTVQELEALLKQYFSKVSMQGIFGNERIMQYYQENKQSVEKITKWDILNLQYRLPRQLLQFPYDLLNRINRKRLQGQNDTLVASIQSTDFSLSLATDECFDFFCIATR